LALNGTMLWKTKIASSIYFSSPSAKGGLIYIGSDDSKLHAVYANGTGEAWNVTVPGKVRSSPLLMDDKIVITYGIYQGNVAIDGGVAAYRYNGIQEWNVNINSTSSSAALTSNGIVATSVSGVTMVSFNGTVIWTKNLGVVKSSPGVSKSGIYVISYSKPAAAYMLDFNGNVLFNKTLLPADYSMVSPTVANGRVYLASDNGYVYCLENLPPSFTATIRTTNLQVSFEAMVMDNEPCTVTWDFGDGNTSTGLMVNHTYAKAGNYTLTAWALDSQGGNSSLLHVVTTKEAATSTDNTTLYVIVAIVAVVLVAAIIFVFARSRKK
jgi:outer membrane protein assembly factor BamB